MATVSVSGAAAGKGVGEGSKAPAVSAKSIDGKKLSWKALLKKHKVIVVDFWAEWCEPCKEEVPFLNKLYKKHKKDGLLVIGINIDKTEKKMNAFLDGKKIAFPIVHDAKAKFVKKYNPPKMPTSYIIDSEGKVRHMHAGFHLSKDGKKMKKEIKKLLKD
ncbi:MAG: TlpA family protein disulfide reductase [Polyangiales bacterium]